MIFGYLRTSTFDQCTDRQLDALKSECDRLYIEKCSAENLDRPLFRQVLKKLQPGDTLIVMSIDRAFRSTVDAITQAEKLNEREITFQIQNLSVDTSTADGMLAYTIVAAVAQHERARISERTRQGIEAARRRGKRIGRPPKLSRQQLSHAARRLAKSQASYETVGRSYGVSGWTLSRALKRAGFVRRS